MVRRPRLPVRAFGFVLVTLAALVTACGGTSVAPSTTPSVPPATSSAVAATASPTVAPSTIATPRPSVVVTPAASPTPVPDPAPLELQGTWRAMDEPGRLELTLTAGTYRIVRDRNTGTGKIAVTGDAVRFFGSSLCTGDGRYTWRVEGEQLTLTPVQPDECGGRADALVGITYTLIVPPA